MESQSDAQAGDLTSTQIKKVFNEVSEKVTGDTLNAPSTEAYLAEWMTGVKARCAIRSVERYKKTVKLFLDHLGPKAQKPVTALTPRDFESFLNSRLTEGVAPQSVEHTEEDAAWASL